MITPGSRPRPAAICAIRCFGVAPLAPNAIMWLLIALAPALVAGQPAVAQALVDGVLEAITAIRSEPERAAVVIARRLQQPPEVFVAATRTLVWFDRADNRAWFAGPMARFLRDAADVLRASAAIERVPELAVLADARFLGPP